MKMALCSLEKFAKQNFTALIYIYTIYATAYAVAFVKPVLTSYHSRLTSQETKIYTRMYVCLIPC